MFRSRDGADNWDRNEQGFACLLRFPDRYAGASRTLFAVPLEADQYRVPVGGAFRSSAAPTAGQLHSAFGRPARGQLFGIVLRGAMAVDT